MVFLEDEVGHADTQFEIAEEFYLVKLSFKLIFAIFVENVGVSWVVRQVQLELALSHRRV